MKFRRAPPALYLITVPVMLALLYARPLPLRGLLRGRAMDGVYAQLTRAVQPGNSLAGQLADPGGNEIGTVTAPVLLQANVHNFFQTPAYEGAADLRSDHLVGPALPQSRAQTWAYEFVGDEADRLKQGMTGSDAFHGAFYFSPAFIIAHPGLRSSLDRFTMGKRYYWFTRQPLVLSLGVDQSAARPLIGEAEILYRCGDGVLERTPQSFPALGIQSLPEECDGVAGCNPASPCDEGTCDPAAACRPLTGYGCDENNTCTTGASSVSSAVTSSYAGISSPPSSTLPGTCVTNSECLSGRCLDGWCQPPSSAVSSSSVTFGDGDLAIRSVDVPARQYQPGTLGEPILKVQMTAVNEDVNVQELRFTPVESYGNSVEYLSVFRDGMDQPVGRAARAYCAARPVDAKDYFKLPFCVHFAVPLSVLQGRIVTLTVRPQLRQRNQGFQRGERLQFSLTDEQPTFEVRGGSLDAVEAVGVQSQAPLSLYTNAASGRIMMGTIEHAGGYIQGPEGTAVFAKIVSISGAVEPMPSWTYASTAIGLRPIARFTIRPDNPVTLRNVLFTVHANNMRLSPSAFKIVDDRFISNGTIPTGASRQPVEFPCQAQTMAGDPVRESEISGVFLVSCRVGMNFFADPSVVGDLKLLGDILDERTVQGAPSSIDVLWKNLSENLPLGAFGSHISWNTTDDAWPMMWIDQPVIAIRSILVENPVRTAGGGSADDTAVCADVQPPMGIIYPGGGGTAGVTFRNAGNRTWKTSDGYRLSQITPPGSNLPMQSNPLPLPNDVPPGQNARFIVSFTAPNIQGQQTYQIVTQMTRNGVAVPSDTCRVPITVGVPIPDPTNDMAMCAGVTFKYKSTLGVWITSDSIPSNSLNFVIMSVNMKNAGDTTWKPEGGYSLGVTGVDPSPSMTAITAPVAPNTNKIFEGQVLVPTQVGPHPVTVRMRRSPTMQNPNGSFGDTCSKTLTITK